MGQHRFPFSRVREKAGMRVFFHYLQDMNSHDPSLHLDRFPAKALEEILEDPRVATVAEILAQRA